MTHLPLKLLGSLAAITLTFVSMQAVLAVPPLQIGGALNAAATPLA